MFLRQEADDPIFIKIRKYTSTTGGPDYFMARIPVTTGRPFRLAGEPDYHMHRRRSFGGSTAISEAQARGEVKIWALAAEAAGAHMGKIDKPSVSTALKIKAAPKSGSTKKLKIS